MNRSARRRTVPSSQQGGTVITFRPPHTREVARTDDDRPPRKEMHAVQKTRAAVTVCILGEYVATYDHAGGTLTVTRSGSPVLSLPLPESERLADMLSDVLPAHRAASGKRASTLPTPPDETREGGFPRPR